MMSRGKYILLLLVVLCFSMMREASWIPWCLGGAGGVIGLFILYQWNAAERDLQRTQMKHLGTHRPHGGGAKPKAKSRIPSFNTDYSRRSTNRRRLQDRVDQ